VEGKPHREPEPSRTIDYVETRLAINHVRASALPVLFPPVRVETPGHAGWYMDGGTRLNTPLRPALDLGARRLVVIGTDAVVPRATNTDCEPPDVGDGALHLLQGILVDPLVRDIWMLGRLNVVALAGKGHPDIPYRAVPYMFVAPTRSGAIGQLADEIFRARYGGLRGLRSPDMRLLNRLLGGDSPTHGELLSYLLFDREFVDALIEMGVTDALAALKASPGSDWPWELNPPEAIAAARTPGSPPAGAPASQRLAS
jgi:NTE family protein